MRLLFLLCVPAAICVALSCVPASAQALKGAGTCNDEYKANKPAIRAAKEKKADFIAACRALPLGTPTPIGAAGGAASRGSDVGTFKTAGQCDDEYKQAKAALKAAKEKKKDFIARCRSLPPGTVTPVNGAAAAPTQPAPPPPSQAPAPEPSPAPSPAPPPRSSQTQEPKSAAPGESACGNGYAHLPTSHTAVQFCTDQEAKARCPSGTVVWVNTKSKVYHYPGANTYGHTREGAYMCESDATAEGDRASKNGH